MKFVFCDKSDTEKETLIELLHSEGIKYCVKREVIEFPCDCDDEDCDYVEFLPIYHIEAYTTTEKFEFMKVLLEKKLAEKELLEKCFKMKQKRKRAVKK